MKITPSTSCLPCLGSISHRHLAHVPQGRSLKVSLLSFLFMSILCATQVMAEFVPGTYYLQTATYTCIEALAVNSSNPGARFQSSSATAFTFTAVNGGYTIQNSANGNYLLYSTANNWDTKMSASASETNYAGTWSISEDAEGKISISRQFTSTTYYLGNGDTNAGTGVFSGQDSPVWYTLIYENPFIPFDSDKYYTLKTGTPESYFTCYANATVLGKSAAAPSYDNLDNYLWRVVGDEINGYTLQNKATGLYVQNPATIADAEKVRMTADASNASKYKFVDNTFQLVSDPSFYLASYSSSHDYMTIHDNSKYSGSKITKNPVEKIVAPQQGNNVIDGNGSALLLKAAHYITNIDSEGKRKYDVVPEGKAWQISVDVMHEAGQKKTFNQYGSCILSSTSDPVNTYYWNNFQVFEHAAPRKTLNFKSNKADGNDHIIAQGHQVLTDAGYENYRVIVRYNGDNVYIIRTIILNAEGNETSQVFNNVWIASRRQSQIDVMSCALPVGTSLKDLKISIAEESNLMEDVDYAIQNIKTEDYLTATFEPTGWYSPWAGDAAHYQIEWTQSEDLTYTDSDGGLHHSFYIKCLVGDTYKYLGSNNNTVDNLQDAAAFIYSDNSNQIQPITAKEKVGDAWAINTTNNTWLWDFFANFYVEVDGNPAGGLTYMKGGVRQTATNGQYLELPAGVKVSQMANSSQAGFMAEISKQDIRIKVKYTSLENTFYYFTDKSTEAKTLYYWYKGQGTLVTYGSTNTDTGNIEPWGEKGDCSKFTITQAQTIPVRMNRNTVGTNADNRWYGTIYCPNQLTLPDGVTAYRLNSFSATSYLLKPIEGRLLPGCTPAVLVTDEATDVNPSGEWAINYKANNSIDDINLFSGVFLQTANTGNAGEKDNSTVYVLGNQPVNGEQNLGFYPYDGTMIPAFKAYHELQTADGSAPLGFAFSFDDSTEPEQLHVVTPDAVAVYYDMQGRSVAHPVPGHLYICNGKKIIY